MKRNIVRFLSLVIVFAFITGVFSCAEDTECRLKVVVKDAYTQARIPNINVHVGKGSGSVKDDGVSDANGEAFFTFEMEAIMDITISAIVYNENGVPIGTRQGKSTVRLIAGELVEKDVLLQ
ncbi:MAG: hypothetical protein LBR17_00360 [Bacteroidales bacterium]|jgi:hypothetical protein|nr:hypothetical protein [Bacteroidales bacterium]